MTAGVKAQSARHLFIWALFATLACAGYIYLRDDGSETIFWYLLRQQDQPAAAALLALLVISWWSRNLAIGVEKLPDWIGERPFGVIACATIALSIAARFAYHAHPLSMDEYAAWFQSRVFADGHLTGQFPTGLMNRLIEPPFQNYFLTVNPQTGQVASAYWPGFSLLMAPFSMLGVPWLCNPFISGLCLWVLWLLADRLFGSKRARGWVLLFTCASPAFVANGISFYSMQAHLLLNLVFVLLILRADAAGCFLAGMVGGWALSLHNPLPHMLFSAPWLVWLMVRRPTGWKGVFWLLSGYLIVGSVLVLGWFYWAHYIFVPFGALPIGGNAEPTPAGTARDYLSMTIDVLKSALHCPSAAILDVRLAGTVKLWLWSAPFLVVLAIWGAANRATTFLKLLCWSAITTFFGYFLISFDQGHGWGYRYFHSGFGVLPLLAVAGLHAVGECEPGTMLERGRMIVVATVLSLFAGNALRLWQIESFMVEHLAQLPPAAEGRTLMFHTGIGYYARDLIQNDPWLCGSVIMIGRRSSEDAALLSRYYPQAKFVGSNRYGRTYRLEP